MRTQKDRAAARRAYLEHMLSKYVGRGLTFDQVMARLDGSPEHRNTSRRTIRADLAKIDSVEFVSKTGLWYWRGTGKRFTCADSVYARNAACREARDRVDAVERRLLAAIRAKESIEDLTQELRSADEILRGVGDVIRAFDAESVLRGNP